MASPLHYIFQAAMGQCSTLPTDSNKADVRAPMSPSSHSTSRRGYRQQREESDPHGRDGDDSRRQTDGDAVMRDGHTRSSRHMMNVAKESSQKFEPSMEDGGEGAVTSRSYHSGRSSRSSSRRGANTSVRPITAVPQEFFPPPPEGSVRTRCYRLNLDVPVVLSPTHDSLGPFNYATPSHLQPTSSLSHRDREINMAMSVESVEKSPQQIAIDTARIFRGIKVDNNGNIVSRNDRANRSKKSNPNASKTAESSRQSAKIDKANDLVDEMVSGKENSGEKPNMISVFPMGEYDDMKQLVRDGAKKLREAEGKGDEWILSLNRSRGSSRNRRTDSEYPSPQTTSSTSRRKLSPSISSSQHSEMPGTPSPSRAASVSQKMLASGNRQLAPPKIRAHPRDHPSRSSRRMDRAENPRYAGEKCNNMSIFGGAESGWSEALNFNSIWNCGGTGATMSPSNNTDAGTNANNGRSARFEGRNEQASTRFSRGVSERDAPMIL